MTFRAPPPDDADERRLQAPEVDTSWADRLAEGTGGFRLGALAAALLVGVVLALGYFVTR